MASQGAPPKKRTSGFPYRWGWGFRDIFTGSDLVVENASYLDLIISQESYQISRKRKHMLQYMFVWRYKIHPENSGNAYNYMQIWNKKTTNQGYTSTLLFLLEIPCLLWFEYSGNMIWNHATSMTWNWCHKVALLHSILICFQISSATSCAIGPSHPLSKEWKVRWVSQAAQGQSWQISFGGTPYRSIWVILLHQGWVCI